MSHLHWHGGRVACEKQGNRRAIQYHPHHAATLLAGTQLDGKRLGVPAGQQVRYPSLEDLQRHCPRLRQGLELVRLGPGADHLDWYPGMGDSLSGLV